MKLKRPVREFRDTNGALVRVPIEFNIVGVDKEKREFICELRALEDIIIDSGITARIAQEIVEKIIKKAEVKVNNLLPLNLTDESERLICLTISNIIAQVFDEYSLTGARLSEKGNIIFD